MCVSGCGVVSRCHSADRNGVRPTGHSHAARPCRGCPGLARPGGHGHGEGPGNRAGPDRSNRGRRHLRRPRPPAIRRRRGGFGRRVRGRPSHRDRPRGWRYDNRRCGVDGGRSAGDGGRLRSGEDRGYDALGGGCRPGVRGDRGAAAERPQLPGARLACARQCARPQLRSDEIQQCGDFLGGAAGPRREHHHRRVRQQRRCGWGAAAERNPGVRARVPDCDEPVHGGVGALRLLGDQRGHQVRDRSPARVGVALCA